jgi:hypothetical protein
MSDRSPYTLRHKKDNKETDKTSREGRGPESFADKEREKTSREGRGPESFANKETDKTSREGRGPESFADVDVATNCVGRGPGSAAATRKKAAKKGNQKTPRTQDDDNKPTKKRRTEVVEPDSTESEISDLSSSDPSYASSNSQSESSSAVSTKRKKKKGGKLNRLLALLSDSSSSEENEEVKVESGAFWERVSFLEPKKLAKTTASSYARRMDHIESKFRVTNPHDIANLAYARQQIALWLKFKPADEKGVKKLTSILVPSVTYIFKIFLRQLVPPTNQQKAQRYFCTKQVANPKRLVKAFEATMVKFGTTSSTTSTPNPKNDFRFRQSRSRQQQGNKRSSEGKSGSQ